MKYQILFVFTARIKEIKSQTIQSLKKQLIQEPVNPRKMAKQNNLTDVEKSSPSVNDFFESKQTIEYLETELTGSLTKIG